MKIQGKYLLMKRVILIGTGYDTTHNGDADVFLTKFKPGLSDNQPPNKPNINGPTSGKINDEYIYTTSTTDPDDDDVFYLFDWGNGMTSFIQGPYESGEECSGAGIWFDEGNYEIKVKAIDIHNAESEWSDPLSISIPKSRSYINHWIINFLDNHPNMFPLLRLIINL